MSTAYSRALDARLSLRRWVNSEEAIEYFGHFGPATPFTEEKVRQQGVDENYFQNASYAASLTGLSYGSTYYWSTTMVQNLQGSIAGLGQHIPSDIDLPDRSGFFWFEGGLDVPSDPEHSSIRNTRVQAVTWSCYVTDDTVKTHSDVEPEGPGGLFYRGKAPPTGVAITEYAWVERLGRVVPQMHTINRFNHPIQCECPREIHPGRNTARAFWAACLLLKLQVFVSESQGLDRATRKRLERDPLAQKIGDVQVIYLRRRATANYPTSAPGDEPGDEPTQKRQIDWSCQWIVGRHTRQQWYPSLGGRREIVIEPYIKGPEDRPLKNPERVFAVIR